MLQTGVTKLDFILGGGIPSGDVLLVVGPPGAGKTTLCLQMAFHAAASGQCAIYVSSLSESPARTLRHVRAFSFFDETAIGKRLFLLNIYPLVVKSLIEATTALAQAVQEHHAALMIIDGLMTIRDLHPTTSDLRTFIYDLGATLAALECTTVVTSSATEYGDGSPLPEFTMADVILELGMRSVDVQTSRCIAAKKMRGISPRLGQHTLRTDGQGVSVFPRLETLYEPEDVGLSAERLSSGLPELDAMLAGGIPAGGSTLIAGSVGTGKTLLCLQFLLEGARRGEKGLFVSLRETPRQLVDKDRALGMDLEPALRDGLITLLHHPVIEADADEITWELWREVERLAPRRLALDGVTELEWGLGEARRRSYMAALADMLRRKGLTAVATKQIAQVVGPELDFSDTPLAVLAENLLLLRLAELRGELHRVLTKLESAEGVPTGIARLPSEVRVKR